MNTRTGPSSGDRRRLRRTAWAAADARALSAQANEAHRRKAVLAAEAVNAGVPAQAVADVCAVTVKTVYEWIARARAEAEAGGGQ